MSDQRIEEVGLVVLRKQWTVSHSGERAGRSARAGAAATRSRTSTDRETLEEREWNWWPQKSSLVSSEATRRYASLSVVELSCWWDEKRESTGQRLGSIMVLRAWYVAVTVCVCRHRWRGIRADVGGARRTEWSRVLPGREVRRRSQPEDCNRYQVVRWRTGDERFQICIKDFTLYIYMDIRIFIPSIQFSICTGVLKQTKRGKYRKWSNTALYITFFLLGNSLPNRASSLRILFRIANLDPYFILFKSSKFWVPIEFSYLKPIHRILLSRAMRRWDILGIWRTYL